MPFVAKTVYKIQDTHTHRVVNHRQLMLTMDDAPSSRRKPGRSGMKNK